MRWVQEARKHGVDLSVKLVDKAALDRSGAVAQGLSAINTYMGENDPSRIAGAAGFSVRDHKIHIYTFKCCLLAAGGAVNVFRPRSVGEGMGRAWYPVWNAGSTYAMAAEAGAELTLMENRFVPARFKDGYGPVGAWFLLF